MKKVTVDKDLCIGCGTCVSLCPAVFELKDDMKAHVKAGADLTKNESCIKESVDACPVQAISVE
ncbi:ferredoxin [Candidatus Berkelbacteria bacterium RIFCSPHIGHO2_12_FULL_36_9]|uniref:Ferredoxin n=1 Tax=Candidatus Berkelbacteria bacterium RIFCSPHIGHO2_12_FULL_36_9 TaxID=1797469 RepID=A0A1F5EFP1_9BACT|nr:MAG: ferredoxin [Candidatus Berkelbacteria bacterium RIFCSPHIGHO2_12_FULL_36_9]